MSGRPRLEVADVVRAHRAEYFASRGQRVTVVERKILSDIVACRTAVLGGHVYRCDGCGHEEVSYNSCRNRHCPKCQAAAREQWMADREADLLPVPYFHVVFTVPREIAAMAFQNKAMHVPRLAEWSLCVDESTLLRWRNAPFRNGIGGLFETAGVHARTTIARGGHCASIDASLGAKPYSRPVFGTPN